MDVTAIYNAVNAGDYSPAFNFRKELNDLIIGLLGKECLNDEEVDILRKCIVIGYATYENTDTDILPIEDGIWDMMVQKYRKYTPNNSYPVGSRSSPVSIQKNIIGSSIESNENIRPLFVRVTDEEKKQREEMIFPEIVNYNREYDSRDFIKYLFEPANERYITKRLHETTHNHPDLVGTFDKCKFVLESQAREKGVDRDPNVSIMERDYFAPLLQSGVIDYNRELTMIATLKYDGISVEADVAHTIISARTRGDTGEGRASDITPFLGGYVFPRTDSNFMRDKPMGMKFEAIINKYNLAKVNEIKQYEYKNCRTAIIGISSSSDAYKYRDLITLIPISTDYKDEDGNSLDRLVEIEFLNKYYSRDEYLRYSVLSGTYTQLLFQIKRYVEEAENARQYLPFMYDGVVFEFYDRDIREALGRDNSMDRYKCAIKFNPLVKRTTFREYRYTVGQDGTITPMIYYDPVEFFGTIHPKSSGHSYENFKKLDLHVGDIIEVTYINDVITYVKKPDNEYNRNNAKNDYTIYDDFPTHCPVCGTDLEISKSGKSAYCPNIDCQERCIQRMSSTIARLGIVNFGEETIRALRYYHLWQLLEANIEDLSILGDNNKVSLYNQLQIIKQSNVYDFKIMGALGFSNIADKTWKLIFHEIKYIDLIDGINSGVITKDNFPNIKGIGPGTIDVILDEWEYFKPDIIYVTKNLPIVETYGTTSGKQIRFTGCRDKSLEEALNMMGHDADGNASVTKKTDILIVPFENHSSAKVTKAKANGTLIVPLQDFKNNMDQFL